MMRVRGERADLDLCCGLESKEALSAVCGSVYDSIGYAMIFDWWTDG